jgi:hypothetical protein
MVRTESDESIEHALAECRSKVEGALRGCEVGKGFESVLAVVAEVRAPLALSVASWRTDPSRPCFEQANARYSALQPWLPETPLRDIAKASFYSISALRLSALLLHPIMPSRMTALLDKLAIPADERTWARAEWEGLEAEAARAGDWPAAVQDGVRRKVGGKVLFERIEDDEP